MTAEHKTEGSVKFEGAHYPWYIEQCEESPEWAVYLDFGNGKPEHIGYTDNPQDAPKMAIEELETLAA